MPPTSRLPLHAHFPYRTVLFSASTSVSRIHSLYKLPFLLPCGASSGCVGWGGGLDLSAHQTAGLCLLGSVPPPSASSRLFQLELSSKESTCSLLCSFKFPPSPLFSIITYWPSSHNFHLFLRPPQLALSLCIAPVSMLSFLYHPSEALGRKWK